jgi:hypothetical protein
VDGGVHRLLIVTGFVALASLTGGGRAAADPLWQAEVRAGYGIAMGGSGARMSTRPSPVTLAAIAAVATSVEPPLSGYGGLLVEALDRNSVGSVFGIKWTPHDSRLRLAGGGTWLIAPYMLFGATASVGACARWKPRIAVCGDIQLTAYFAGDDLADGRSVTQAQLAVGLVFDAL